MYTCLYLLIWKLNYAVYNMICSFWGPLSRGVSGFFTDTYAGINEIIAIILFQLNNNFLLMYYI